MHNNQSLPIRLYQPFGSNCVQKITESFTLQQVQKVVEKGYTQVHADNAPLTVQNPMAYRKSMRITNQNGQTIFAYIEEDEEASRKICFCQQYSDGTFSRTLTISQADVVTIIMAGGGSDILYEHDESETSKKLEKV